MNERQHLRLQKSRRSVLQWFGHPCHVFERVGRVALESTSAVLQTAAKPSQLPAHGLEGSRHFSSARGSLPSRKQTREQRAWFAEVATVRLGERRSDPAFSHQAAFPSSLRMDSKSEKRRSTRTRSIRVGSELPLPFFDRTVSHDGSA